MTQKTSRVHGKILGVRVDGTPKDEVLARIAQKTKLGSKILVTTPNPEIILKAQTNKKLAKVLNSADFSLPDGFGLVLAAIALRENHPKHVIHGRQFFLDLIDLANKEKWRVFLLGDDGAPIAQKILARKYKNIRFKSAVGPMLNNEATPISKNEDKTQNNIISQINKFRPHLLFVAFGAPKQELWLDKHLPKLKVNTAMVVGGALDYVNGRTKLPPRILSNLHLEWLWRLLTQPKRTPRILRALIVFPIKVLTIRTTSGTVK